MFSDLFKTSVDTDERNDVTKYEKDKIPTHYVRNRYYRDTRPCIRSNYIPFLTPTKSNFDEWYNTYLSQIDALFKIFKNIINSNYPKNKIKWNDKVVEYNFIKVIYHCSSKHIDKLV